MHSTGQTEENHESDWRFAFIDTGRSSLLKNSDIKSAASWCVCMCVYKRRRACLHAGRAEG